MRCRRRAFGSAHDELALEERAALELLEQAGGHTPGDCWHHVGRVVGQSLARRRFVYVFRELAVLIDPGRGALIRVESGRQCSLSRHPSSNPEHPATGAGAA